MISSQVVSRNFETIKVLSILIVLWGHFFEEIDLAWIPVTVGLIVFSFSSGYFTSLKYRKPYDLKVYFKNKINRLFSRLLVINLFLLFLFLVQQREGIFNWHTVVNMLGFNGFLNWFYIENQSPFGAGMWFFTLLLLFYLVYPVLERISTDYTWVFSFVFILLALFLNTKIKYGHALWLTSCGFVTGVSMGKKELCPSLAVSIVALILSMFAMVTCNLYFGIKRLNPLLLLAIALLSNCSVLRWKYLLRWFDVIVMSVSGCLLEIYLVHPYINLRLTDIRWVDFLLSTIVVILTGNIIKRGTLLKTVINKQQ